MKLYLLDNIKSCTSDKLRVRAVLRLYRQWGVIDNTGLKELLKESNK
jgi:hypothetical protein